MRSLLTIACLSTVFLGSFRSAAAQDIHLVPIEETDTSSNTSSKVIYRLPSDATGFYAGIDFLYWKVNENGNDFAIKRTTPVNPNIGSGLLGKFYEGEFEWQPGVRPWIGYQFKPDHWKIEGVYTFYQTGKSTHVKQPEAALVNTDLASLNATLNGDLGNATASASSSTNFIYNAADVSLKKVYQMSPYFYMTLQAGLKGLWVRQHWHVTYKDILNNIGKHREFWKYYGGGPRIGLETEWYLGKGFSFEFMGAAAFLYGEKTQKQKYTLYLVDSGTIGTFPFQDFSLSKNTTLPTTELKASVRWGRVFMDFLEFNIHAGYEIQGIYNINEDYRFIADVNPIDEKAHTYRQTSVFLQGLFVGIDMHF